MVEMILEMLPNQVLLVPIESIYGKKQELASFLGLRF